MLRLREPSRRQPLLKIPLIPPPRMFCPERHWDGLDRPPEAIAEFQAAAKASSQEPNVHFGLGYLYWKLLQFDNAKAAI